MRKTSSGNSTRTISFAKTDWPHLKGFKGIVIQRIIASHANGGNMVTITVQNNTQGAAAGVAKINGSLEIIWLDQLNLFVPATGNPAGTYVPDDDTIQVVLSGDSGACVLTVEAGPIGG